MNTLVQHVRLVGAAIMIAAGLSACGGGGGDSATPPAAVTAAEGSWSGTTSTNRTVNGIVLDDGSYYVLYTVANNPNTLAGFVQGTGSASSGSFSSSNAVDYNLEGSGVNQATLSASYVARQSLNGTISYAGGTTTTFNSTYDPSYELAPAPLATIANTFIGTLSYPGMPGQPASLAASATGVISGTSNGCTISGSIAPRTVGNAYNVSLVFAGACSQAGSTFTGVADYSATSKVLLAAATNASRSSGLLFMGTGSSCSGTWPVTHVTASIAAPTTWSACNVYAIDNSISVNAALTIQPGAAVKFASGTSMTVSSTGTISANGTAADNIVFTSIKDDSVGGDSNGDGTATAPLVGDWGKIVLNASGSVFNYTKFSYGGATDSTLQIGGNFANSATITNSAFASNNGGDIASSWNAVGALDAGSAKAGTVITGNTFYGNNVPLSISGAFSIDDSNVFHNPAAASVKNTYNGIFHMGHSSKPVTGMITYAETEVPFVLSGYIDVPAGSALTLGDNVVVKFLTGGDSLGTSGTIVANATAGNRIVFTSMKDDAHGGDTNGDGAISSPMAGDWARVVVNANGSIFNRAEFYYGGWDTANRETLNLNTYSATVTNSVFAHNHGGDMADLYFNAKGALNASNAAAATVIAGNTFYANNVPLRVSGNFSVDDSNVFHDPAAPATTNTYNGIVFAGNSANYISTISLLATEVPFAIQGDIWVNNGSVLTIGDNVAFKFNAIGTKITVEGSVVNQNGAGVVFTSLKDDTVKGDTNGDGGASTPAFADWLGIRDATWYYILLPNAYYYKCSSGNVC